MALHQLIEKIRMGTPLSQEERQHMLSTIDSELRLVREKDPKAYLELLNLVINAMRLASQRLAA